jgi:3-deoxy-manno-octulosonate cytidylyltransferase (CMP-KDO synthetase)
VVMTRSDHDCGTDRIAEVAESSDADIIVNVQGDEALIDPNTIDSTIRALLDNPDVPMATTRHLITDPEKVRDPNVVKVVCDQRGFALYFSRSPIPFIRDWSDRAANLQCYWQHIGLYVFRRAFLLEFAKMPQSPLENIEKLEQLRVIEAGIPIAVVDTEYESIGVDTPDDLRRVAELLKK